VNGELPCQHAVIIFVLYTITLIASPSHSRPFFFFSLCHFSPRIMVISPDTHFPVILPRIVPAAFCMLELVDVICLIHAWIERCEPYKG